MNLYEPANKQAPEIFPSLPVLHTSCAKIETQVPCQAVPSLLRMIIRAETARMSLRYLRTLRWWKYFSKPLRSVSGDGRKIKPGRGRNYMGCTQRCECTAREDFVFKVVTKEERRSRRNDISGWRHV